MAGHRLVFPTSFACDLFIQWEYSSTLRLSGPINIGVAQCYLFFPFQRKNYAHNLTKSAGTYSPLARLDAPVAGSPTSYMAIQHQTVVSWYLYILFIYFLFVRGLCGTALKKQMEGEEFNWCFRNKIKCVCALWCKRDWREALSRTMVSCRERKSVNKRCQPRRRIYGRRTHTVFVENDDSYKRI